METLPYNRDFTWEQSLEITKIIWNGAHEGFVNFMAQFIYDHGFSALTDRFITQQDAEKITEYLLEQETSH